MVIEDRRGPPANRRRALYSDQWIKGGENRPPRSKKSSPHAVAIRALQSQNPIALPLQPLDPLLLPVIDILRGQSLSREPVSKSTPYPPAKNTQASKEKVRKTEQNSKSKG
jgi:hypothetical protein